MLYCIECTPHWSPVALRRSQAVLNNPHRSAQKQFAQPIVNLVMTLPSPRERCGGRVQEKPAIVLSISWMFPKMSMNAEGPTALCIYCVEREWVGYSD